MKFQLPKFLIFLAGFGVLLNCSTGRSLLQDYQDMEGDLKAEFISYYPFLTPSQRADLLDDPKNFHKYLSRWNIPRIESSEIRNKHKLTSISIEPKGDLPLTSGTSLPLRAYALYSDGRRVEVTEDVQWLVLPTLARMSGSKLKFDCGYSDVSVSANFLDEAQGLEVFKIRKPIQSLHISVAESSAVVEASEYVRMKLIAQCTDGTTQDVTCQADWKTDPEWGSFLGCGNLHASKLSFREGIAQITATYGTKATLQTVHLPARSLRH